MGNMARRRQTTTPRPIPQIIPGPQATFSEATKEGLPQEAIDASAIYYAQVGRIAHLWAMLEHMLDDMIWSLSNLDKDIGACITSQIYSVQYRIQAISAICRFKGASKETLDLLNSLDREARSLVVDRNIAVHNPIAWSTTQNIALAHRVEAKKLVLSGIVEADYQELVRVTTTPLGTTSTVS